MTMLALFGFTIRQILGQRKLWLAVALLLFPAAIAVLVRVLGVEQSPRQRWEMYHVLMQFLLFMLLMPLVCMLYGTSLIGAEVEQRTLVYLVTRKLHRRTVLLVRYAAGWLALTVVCEAALLVLHLCVTLNSGPIELPQTEAAWQPWPVLRCYLAVMALGVAAFLAAFMTISLVFSRSLMVSVVYLILFEVVLGNLPLAASQVSLNHALRQTMVYGIPEVRRLYDYPRETLDLIYPLGQSGVLAVAVAVVVTLAVSVMLVTVRELVPARVSRD